jgi:hypothetical protein
MGGILGPFGWKPRPEPFEPKPGMLKIAAMFLFRNESDMLDFASVVHIDDGILHAEYHYDPQHAIVFRGFLPPTDLTRLLSSAGDFPGIAHASAELESLQ